MATDLENILVTKTQQIAPYNAIYGKDLPGLQKLYQFGKMAIVNHGKEANKIKPKYLNHRRVCIYLGRAPNTLRTHRFLNLNTLRIISSRDDS